MAIWFQIALVLGVVYWLIFCYLLTRRRWNAAALAVGVLHMIIASVNSVAPIRSLLDPNYVGWQIGFIRFDGWAVPLPATLFLAWALAAAWIAVAHERGRWMKLIAVGDTLFGLNLIASILLEVLQRGLADIKIQGGEIFTLTGTPAALILMLLFGLPLAASALWATRRSSSGGSTPPFAADTQGKVEASEKDSKGIDSFRYSESRV